MNAEIKHFPEMRVGAVHHTGPYDTISAAFQQLGAVAGQAGLFNRPGAAMLGLYYDIVGSKPASELESDAAVLVSDDVALPAGLTEKRIPAGDYACAVHTGPYESLGESWRRLMDDWLPSSGRRMGTGPSCEVYLNNPMTAAPQDLKTELRIPLAAV